MDLDTADEWLKPKFARFLKNLVYVLSDSSQVTTNQNGKAGMFRPFISPIPYDITFALPSGDNQCVGTYVSRETARILFLNHNSNSQHGLYVIDCIEEKIATVYVDPCLGLVRSPEFFLHEGGAHLELFYFTDPNTELQRLRSYFIYTLGTGYQKYICIEDSLATEGFNASTFPYFKSAYDKCNFINCGVITPECPVVDEVANDDPQKPNFLKFNTWQFRIQYIDVYGRMSEWGKISELYVSGMNDCISSSDLLARCVNLTFDAGTPFTDKINVAFRNCNDESWQQDTTLFLYKGSCLGDWWLRSRNPDINYNAQTNTITYQFCKDKECIPIDVNETNRTQNPMPRESQSIEKVGNVVSFWNNKDGFNPVDMSQISVTVAPPSQTDNNTALVEIYVPVINVFTQTYQPVYPDDNGKFVWGGRYSSTNQHVQGIYENYRQHFGSDTQKGFIGYLAGTGTMPNSTVSELYYADDTNNFIKVDDYSIVFNPPFTRRWYHKFTFASVPKGKYLFRIASHLALVSTSNFASTSTYVYGSFAWANKSVSFNNSRPANFGAISLAKELLIDTCAGDYSSLNDNKVLAIFDLTHPGESGSQANVTLDGYIYEKLDPLTSVKEIPVELLAVTANKNGNPMYVTSVYTDHNGFYFTSDGNNEYFAEIFGNCGCNNYKKLISFGSGSFKGTVSEDFVIEGRNECPTFGDAPCNRVLIKGFVKLCGANTPVPGVGVVLSRGAYAISGADGSFTIIAHFDNTSPNRTRLDKLYYVSTLCPFLGCDDACLTTVDISIAPCVQCDTQQTITVADKSVEFKTQRGLLSGGRYGFAIEPEDWLGRHTFAETKDSMYLVMPTIIQSKSFGFPTVTVHIPNTVTFPSYFKKINFLITPELSLETYLTWIVDDVVFIDNTGNENDIAPTQIKIYYGSLNEYNSQNNFNTTTGWQFLDTAKTPNVNFTNDYVEFYVNGDGKIFDQLTRAIIKYDQKGLYFLIDYDTALKDLKKYAQIRLCRPSECQNDSLFFELCGSVEIINGKAQLSDITLTAFDTYNKYRQIPVPIGTTDAPQNIPVTLGIPFQHDSPSDLWGKGCKNIGRVNSRNPYECEIIHPTEAALSGVLSANGQLNFLNYFDDAQKTTFDTWGFGGVVAAIFQTARGLVICENNYFTVGYSDNILRTDSQGQILVPSAEDKFGKPTIQIGNNYGCQLFDKNTIRSWQEYVMYLDTREGVLIRNDYKDSVPVSVMSAKWGIEMGVDSWLRPKIASVLAWNEANPDSLRYFVGGVDPAGKSYSLSDHQIGSGNFVNNERGTKVEVSETIQFDIYNKIWRCFISQTPEMFSMMQSALLNEQWVSFKNGIPYKNYTADPNKTYNTFFGVKCNRVFRVVAANNAFQKKYWKNVTLVCKTLYFADQVLTESNQQTRMLKAMWAKGDFYYSSAIPASLLTISDANTPFRNNNKLFEGDLMYGSIIDIRLIGDPDLDDQFTELYGVIVDLQPNEKVLG